MQQLCGLAPDEVASVASQYLVSDLACRRESAEVVVTAKTGDTCGSTCLSITRCLVPRTFASAKIGTVMRTSTGLYIFLEHLLPS